MNNSDLPAMPNQTQYGKNGGVCNLSDITGPGLTKREHFAAMAMQGMVTNVVGVNYDLVATDAVEMANALLKALES